MEAFAVWVLAVAIVVSPLFLGGTWVWARLGIEVVTAFAIVSWACSGPRSLPLLIVPLLAAAIPLAQLVPLPSGLLVDVAPVSAGAWKVAAPDAWGTISIDPAATAAAGRRLLLGLGVAAVVADLGRQLSNRRILIGALAASGLVVWALAIAFPVDNLDRVLLGFVDLKSPTGFWQTSVDPFWQSAGVGYVNWAVVGDVRYVFDAGVIGDGMGCFISTNQFSNCLVMTVPVLIAGWLYLTRGVLPKAVRITAACILVAAALWTTGVFAKSRAGTSALAFACVVLVTLVAERGWTRRLAEIATVGATSAVVLFCGLLYGPFENVAAWFPSVVQPQVAALCSDPRIVAAKVALRMFFASPLLGTGLDTFSAVFPRFHPGGTTLFYAHNDYAQLLAEGGLVGAALAAGLAAILVVRGNRLYRLVPPPARLLEAGPWAGLAGMAAHAAFDWNMHLPANALMAAVLAGLCAATGGRAVPQSATSLARAARLTCTAVCAVAALLAVGTLGRDAVSETVERELRTTLTHVRKADNDNARAAAADELSAAIVAGDRMVAWDPRNSRLPLLMGQAHLHLAAFTTEAAAAGHAVAAAEAFERARRRSAMLRGAPEPVPPKPR